MSLYNASIELSKERNTRRIFEFFIDWGLKNNQKSTLICDRSLLDTIIEDMEKTNITTITDEITEGSNCLVLEIIWSDEEILSTKWIKVGTNRMILESIEVLARNINLSARELIYAPSSKSWTKELIVFLY